MYITDNDIDDALDDTIKHYDVKDCPPQGTRRSHGEITETASSLGFCCLCTACNCDCHGARSGQNHFNNENFVRYLFDYDLFSVAHNFSRCGYLIAYLKHEGIISNTCVLVSDTHSLRGPYARPTFSKTGHPGHGNRDNSVHVDLFRSPTSGNLQFRRSTNLIEPLLDVPDVRMLMRNYVLSDASRDWLNLRYALQMPTFLIYIKLNGSNNHFPNADLTALFDLRHLRVIESGISVGRRLAELVAGIREKYFDVPLPDFAAIEQEFSNIQLDRSLRKQTARPKAMTTTHDKTRQHDDPINIRHQPEYDYVGDAIADTTNLFISHGKQ